jgi:hypothetical protein
MVPIQDDPVPKGQAPEPEAIRQAQADPVRIVVQAALALYLMPVVLVVCLIGGTSLLAGGAARFAGQLAENFRHRKDRAPIAVARAKVGEMGTRGHADRNRSHVAR